MTKFLYSFLLIFLINSFLTSCSSKIELSDDFSISYSDVDHSYHLYFRSEGIVSNIHEYSEFDQLILVKNTNDNVLYSVDKIKFSKYYGNGANDFIKKFQSEMALIEHLNKESKINLGKINWKKLD